MKKTLEIINELVEKGIIKDYAVGGGIAAMFYIEPFLTYDIDIFVIIEYEEEKIINLTSIFDYLEKKGYSWKGEHILIEGLPVQFIPADNLERQAIKEAKRITYEGAQMKILKKEYLIAILLRAGRKKDMEKVEKLLEENKVDKKKLKDILTKHNLLEKFKPFGDLL
ncbi:MAG TPA: hypothetical protein PKN36_08175 [bacterium]|nr:hypothetical protein [bacterium]